MQRVQRRFPSLAFGRSRQGSLRVPHPGKRRLHPVVILRGNGIEFVVMTSRAPHCHPQERFAGRAHHVVEMIRADLHGGDRILVAHIIKRAANQEGGGHFHLGLARRQDVARQLLHDESVKRFVLVERGDDVIAIRPGIRIEDVAFIAIAFAEADDIEPEASPTLAVVR